MDAHDSFISSESQTNAAADPAPSAAAPETKAFHIVGVGASAGGLEALEQFFHQMPPDSGLAFVVIQHLSPDFKSLMDELLARHTRMKIRRVSQDMPVEPNSIYLIPPRHNLTIEDRRLRLTEQISGQGLHLPIDVFFESLARDVGECSIAVVLSGTGSDGTRGIRSIKEAGGMVMVQTEESAKFDGMPRSVINTGLADFVLPPESMPDQLMRFIQHPYARGRGDGERAAREATKLDEVVRILRKHHLMDFAHYKPATIARRIERRMGITQIETLEEYLALLDRAPTESKSLLKDLLIGVTQFFRDPEIWESLRGQVFSRMLGRLGDDESLRIWVPACSTGEEAYTLAMLAHECLDERNRVRDVKIFATDIDAAAIERASEGVYPESIAADVSPERLKRFFKRRDQEYVVRRELRESVIFATQNVLKDPPFTKLDLISCRNLMIYLQPNTQRRLIALFHFALKSRGYLLLAPSESVGDCDNAFTPVVERHRIYQQNPSVSTTRLRPGAASDLPARLLTPVSASEQRPARPSDTTPKPVALAHEHLVARYAPPTLLVNEQLNLIHTFGDVSKYLRLPDGAFTATLTKLLTGELGTAVSTALYRAVKQHDSIVYNDVRVATGGEARLVDLRVEPLGDPQSGAMQYLVLFEERGTQPAREGAQAVGDAEPAREDYRNERIQDLESELQQSRENLQATIEELETSNEELQSTNEELLASNEELQSTNEELHSVNEELYTVNAELQSKIHELTQLSNDFENLLRSTDIGVVFLDRELRVRRFTPAVCQSINLAENDIGRPIDHFTHNLSGADIVTPLRRAVDTGETFAMEVRGFDNAWLLFSVLPFVLTDGSIDGAVITLVNIEQIKAGEEQLARSEAWIRLLLESTAEGICGLDRDGKVTFINPSGARMLGFDGEAELTDRNFHTLAHHTDTVGEPHTTDRCPILHTVRTGTVAHNPHDVLWRQDGTSFPVEYWAHPIRQDGELLGTVVTFVDNTARDEAVAALAQANQELVRSNQELEQFASIASHDLQEPLRTIRGYSQLLREQYGAALDEQGLDHLGRIDKGIGRLQALITDLLRFSRISARDFERTQVSLNQVVDRTIETLEQVISQRNGRVTRAELPTLAGNEALLGQLLQNLIENALKYARENTPPDVHVSASHDGQQTVVCVADNGCGIKPDYHERIFQVFKRLHSDSQYPGTGIGLAIAKKIVERHGGRIWVESTPGSGSKFFFTLRRLETA